MRKKMALTGITLLCLLAGAQSKVVAPPREDIVEFPFYFYEGRFIIIKASLGNAPAENFIFDTGCDATIAIDYKYAEEIKLKPEKNSSFEMRGVESDLPSEFAITDISFKETNPLRSLTLRRVKGVISDYTKNFGREFREKVKIKGLIGVGALFAKKVVLINYNTQTIRIGDDIDKFHYPGMLEIKMNSRRGSGLLSVKAAVNIEPESTYVIYTGAYCSGFPRPTKGDVDFGKLKPDDFQHFKTLTIGENTFTSSKALLLVPIRFEFGLIGADVLSEMSEKKIIILDYKAKNLYVPYPVLVKN